jgi:hypothetical protein
MFIISHLPGDFNSRTLKILEFYKSVAGWRRVVRFARSFGRSTIHTIKQVKL